MKSCRIFIRNRNGDLVKRILMDNPTEQKIGKLKEKVHRYYSPHNFYVDASEFHIDKVHHEQKK